MFWLKRIVQTATERKHLASIIYILMKTNNNLVRTLVTFETVRRRGGRGEERGRKTEREGGREGERVGESEMGGWGDWEEEKEGGREWEATPLPSYVTSVCSWLQWGSISQVVVSAQCRVWSEAVEYCSSAVPGPSATTAVDEMLYKVHAHQHEIRHFQVLV